MSGIATGTALAIATGVGAAGSIGGALIGSHAAGQAANAQVSAADYAAQLQKQAADQSLAFNQQMWNTQQQNLAPWLQQGKGALANLSYLMGVPFGPGGTSAPPSGAVAPGASPTPPQVTDAGGHGQFGANGGAPLTGMTSGAAPQTNPGAVPGE